MTLFVRFLCAVLALAVPACALAQAYPTKPVRVVIPWPPGGSNDIVGRVVCQKLSEQLGQQFVIENRGGASGTIGSDLVAKSPPDGYTIMVHSATHVANPHLYKNLPYDTLKDFAGLTPLAQQVGAIVVHPSLPARSIKEFIALARARPGEIVYASSGNGSFVHLAMALLNAMTDTKMVHVPYKGGGPAVIAVVSGETQAMAATIGSVLPHLNAKRLRAIGVTADHRVSQFPEVPTIAESGVKGYEFTAWIGAFAPAAVPRPIIERLNGELKKALAAPEVAKTLSSQTLDPMYMTPEQFDQRLRADYGKYQKLIRLTGARID